MSVEELRQALVLAGLIELYFFFLQRTTLDLERDAELPIGSRALLLPSWYPLAWLPRLAKWGFAIAAGVSGGWAIPVFTLFIFFLASVVAPVPYGNFLPLIRRQAALLPPEASPHIIECIDHFGESKRPTGFPIWSLLALLYPTVGAVAFHLATPAPPLAVAGGLLANVGYVMLASAFLAGSFRVFGLRSRRATLVGCGIVIIGGFVAMNAAFSSFVG